MRLAGDNLGSHAAHVPLEQHALVGVRVRLRLRVRFRLRLRFSVSLRLWFSFSVRLRQRGVAEATWWGPLAHAGSFLCLCLLSLTRHQVFLVDRTSSTRGGRWQQIFVT